jgi:hypothetical protein
MRIDHVAVGRIMRAPQAIGPRLIRFAHFGGDDDGCGHGLALTVRARHRYHAVKWTDISRVILNLFQDNTRRLCVILKQVQDDELCWRKENGTKKPPGLATGRLFVF